MERDGIRERDAPPGGATTIVDEATIVSEEGTLVHAEMRSVRYLSKLILTIVINIQVIAEVGRFLNENRPPM